VTSTVNLRGVTVPATTGTARLGGCPPKGRHTFVGVEEGDVQGHVQIGILGKGGKRTICT